MPAIEVIINAGAGSVLEGETERGLKKRMLAHGLKANVHLTESGEEIVALAKEAANGDAEIIIAGGGDGTISAVAREVSRVGKVLGVLPLGTLNNFSKDLGIPQDDLKAAIRIIVRNHQAVIDLAEVNGRTFINNSSIGLYPRIVRKREQQQERLGYGKWRAAIWATLRIFRVSRFLKVRLELDDRSFTRKTPFVFVGNNRYEMDLYNIGRRERLDGGELSVYFLHRGGRWGVVMMLLRTLTGTIKQWRDFEEVGTAEITIQSRRQRLAVALDGETDMLETPLVYKILPGALTVIVPEPEEPTQENA